MDKIIDKSVIHANSWLLPFSKKPEGQLYELKVIFNQHNEAINIPELKANKANIIDIFSLNSKSRSKIPITNLLNGVTFEIIIDEFSKLNGQLTGKETEKPTETEKKELYFK